MRHSEAKVQPWSKQCKVPTTGTFLPSHMRVITFHGFPVERCGGQGSMGYVQANVLTKIEGREPGPYLGKGVEWLYANTYRGLCYLEELPFNVIPASRTQTWRISSFIPISWILARVLRPSILTSGRLGWVRNTTCADLWWFFEFTLIMDILMFFSGALLLASHSPLVRSPCARLFAVQSCAVDPLVQWQLFSV